MSHDNDQTSFNLMDLTIRKRVEAYSAAMEANKDVKVEAKDSLLSQFSREVDNMSAQLAQVEKAFGHNDPMAQVLRQALESARCRKETREIELKLEREEREEEQRAIHRKPHQSELGFVRAQTQEPEKKSSGLVWVAIMALSTNDRNRHPAFQQNVRL